MGGYGSSRWAMTITRVSTAGLPKLDVRALARAGALQPGVSATVTWGSGASVSTEVALVNPDLVLMHYHCRVGDSGWVHIEETLAIARTACTFGGSRAWLICPGCRERRAVLYAFASRFRCRECHYLAYASTRAKVPELQYGDRGRSTPRER